MSDFPETQPGAIIAKLRQYNLWRRGSEQLAQPNPTEIGLCLHAGCDVSERLERERDEARNLADAAMWEADRLRCKLWRAEQEGDSTLTESKRSYWPVKDTESSKSVSHEAREALRKLTNHKLASN